MDSKEIDKVREALKSARNILIGLGHDTSWLSPSIAALDSIPVDKPVEASEDVRDFVNCLTSGMWPNLTEWRDYMVTIVAQRDKSRDDRIREETRREAVQDLAIKIRDWPERASSACYLAESEAYYQIKEYVASLVTPEETNGQ